MRVIGEGTQWEGYRVISAGIGNHSENVGCTCIHNSTLTEYKALAKGKHCISCSMKRHVDSCVHGH